LTENRTREEKKSQKFSRLLATLSIVPPEVFREAKNATNPLSAGAPTLTPLGSLRRSQTSDVKPYHVGYLVPHLTAFGY